MYREKTSGMYWGNYSYWEQRDVIQLNVLYRPYRENRTKLYRIGLGNIKDLLWIFTADNGFMVI